MKKIISLFLICIFASAAFGQDSKRTKVLSNSLENANNLTRSYLQPTIFDAAPPAFAVTGSDGFWDYVTNGSNLTNISVFGNTVVISFANTDSTDPRGATTRVAYYMVSTNGGTTWEAPLAVSTLPSQSGYPEVHTYVSGGQDQVVITGRKYTTASRGGAWKDAFFGLGSFTGANVPQEGRDFFGAYLNGNLVGGLSSVPNGTVEDTLYFAKYDASNNTFSTKVKVADPGLAQIGANVRYRMAADASGNNLLAMWYKDSTGTSFSKLMLSNSTNGGTSWSTPQIVQRTRGLNSVLAPGDTCMTWFGLDAAYKPTTTNYGVVWSTLGPTADNTGGNTASNGSCKILFYSPGINGGVPTIVAGRQNMSIISDTAQFNNRQALQVGVLPVSHPSIGYSADGSRIYVAFSAFQPGDSLDGFTFNDIWYTYSDNGGLSWAQPKNLTNTPTDDELYPTISLTGNSATQFHVHYQSTKGPGSQSFTDVVPTYRVYRCYQKVTVVSVNNISSTVPDKFSLKQNYPNPFNPTTSIRFDVTKSSRMSLNIYDASGKLVQTLINNEVVPTGTNEVVFDAGKLSSGVYFYTLTSDNFRDTKKMMLVK